MIRVGIPLEDTESRPIRCNAQASFSFSKLFLGELSFGDIQVNTEDTVGFDICVPVTCPVSSDQR